jgi:hypothetical protein
MMNDDDMQTKNQELGDINAMIPRRVALYSEEARRFYWVIVAFIGSGILWFGYYSYYSVEQMRQKESLRIGGHDVLGEVVAKGTSRSGVFIDYTFNVNGVGYHGAVLLPNDRRIDPNVGQSIAIRYLPSDPSVSHPSGWERSGEWDLVPNLFMLFFIGLGAKGAVAIIRDKSLARKGWVVEGKVTSCVPKGRRFSVDYKFRTEDGSLMEGTNDYSDEYEVGACIFIIYLRKYPTRNKNYPLDSYRAVSPHDVNGG